MITKRVNAVNATVAILLMAIAFTGLVAGAGKTPFADFYLLAAGLIGYWLLGGNLRTLIRPIRRKDIVTIVLAIIGAVIIGTLLSILGTTLHVRMSGNPVAGEPLTLWFAFKYIFALFGEEMLVIVLLTILEKYLPKTKGGLIAATLISCVIFGACHLGTYDWNFWQSIVVIGFIRLPFTYAWYKSDRNLLVNGAAHWIYDILFLLIAALSV